MKQEWNSCSLFRTQDIVDFTPARLLDAARLRRKEKVLASARSFSAGLDLAGLHRSVTAHSKSRCRCAIGHDFYDDIPTWNDD